MSSENTKKRGAGILMPLFSLPSKYGIGCFSKEAYEFVDFLKKAGQTYWQILPIGPTSYGDSPYQSFSVYAGNPYFIDLDELVEKGWLEKSDLTDTIAAVKAQDPHDIDYGWLYNTRFKLFRKAFENSNIKEDQKFQRYVRKNSYWIKGYALFMALKDSFKGKSFSTWPEDIRLHQKEAVKKAEKEFGEDILFYEFMQFEFEREWYKLRKYANSNGIKIIGDIPIYVAEDSADVWESPELFELDENHVPINIAGCPPDGFAPDGQRWGNPVYNWKYHNETDFAWWVSRMKRCAQLYDIVRIDHFRGFDEYYSIPRTEETARNGKWVKGPGYSLFATIKEEVPNLDVIAEDLGFITPSVKKLIKRTGYPNMKILEFAFDGRNLKKLPKGGEKPNDHLPCNYDSNCVVYTGTHDNETIMGWLSNVDKKSLKEFKAYVDYKGDDKKELTKKMVKLALSSPARYCIIPIQDYLLLGNEARINTPSTLGQNWRFRIDPEALTKKIEKRIRSYCVLYYRV